MSSREVFALRKAGRIGEAVAMGRQDYAASPADPWTLKALAWALHSAIKQESDNNIKTALVDEFLGLPEVPGDEYLINARNGIQRSAAPFAADLQQAREKSKTGDWEGALQQLHAIAQAYPRQREVEIAIAWELCKGVQYGLRDERPDGLKLWRLVEEYGRLGQVPKPSDVHSRILQWAGALARKGLAPRFCEFLKWWDPDRNLRDEDFQGRQKEDGGHYDSTVENTIAGVAKTIEACTNAEVRQKAFEFVARYVGRYPDQEWFPYYHAICLLAAGHAAEARTLMMSVVRAKMTEFWAWEKLGRSFDENSDERLQCLCRAAICPVKGPEFLLGIYADIGSILAARGHRGEGRFLLEKAHAVRIQHHWKIPADLEKALKETEGILAVEAETLIKDLSTQADEVLLSNMPWHKGVVSNLNIEFKRDDGTARRYHFIAVELDGQMKKRLDCRVPANRAFRDLEKMVLGTPVQARVDLSGERPRILSVKPREHGTPWDVYPELIGIIERVNVDRGIVTVLLENGRVAMAYVSSMPEANHWSEGEYVSCRFSERDDKVRVLAARIVAKPQSSPHWKDYSGAYKPRSNGPGGHVAGVFIHKRFCSGLESGQFVKGVAVRKQGDDGRAWWEAISCQSEFEKREIVNTEGPNPLPSIVDILLGDAPFLIQLLSLYYPFSEDEVAHYWDILEKGTAHYTVYLADTESYYSPVLGLCFNSHITWNENLRSKWECGFNNPFRGYVIGCGPPCEYGDAEKLNSMLPLSLDEERRGFVGKISDNIVRCHSAEDPPDPGAYERCDNFSKVYSCMDSNTFALLFESDKDLILMNSSIWENTIMPKLSKPFVKEFLEKKLAEYIKADSQT